MSQLAAVNKGIKNIIWRIMDPPEKARILDGENLIPLEKELLEKKITAKPSYLPVVLIWHYGVPQYFGKFKGLTLYDFMKSIYLETQKKIGPHNSEPAIINILIDNFYKPSTRKKMKKEYEAGKLKVADLIGDYYHFDGGIRKEKINKVEMWTFGLGS